MYARHLAWLNTPAKKPEKSNIETKAPIESMGSNHPQRVMPQVDDDVVNVWRTVGVCKSVGMGIFPIDWQDLHSYYSIVGNKLSEWQSEQVILMSRAYCNACNFYSSNKPQKPPYERQYTIEEQREIGLGLQKQLLDMGF